MKKKTLHEQLAIAMPLLLTVLLPLGFISVTV